jgi:hypothetical protein
MEKMFSGNRSSANVQMYAQVYEEMPIIIVITVRIQYDDKGFAMTHRCGTSFVTLVKQEA